jgi:hypothetical protein
MIKVQFWKGNRADAGFEMPVSEVAARFVSWWNEGAHNQTMPLERALRHWLTARNHFDSVWEAENHNIFGRESFDGLYDLVWDELFKSP